jgi:dTDP-4-dehydrorhamnose 3,5-epimerase
VEVLPTPLPGLLILKPRVFGDRRGYFWESYRQEYTAHGIPSLVQVNLSRSHRGVLRGLHFQWARPQAKLVSVVRGEVFDVAVDIRRGSPHFGRWYGQRLSDQNQLQMFVPVGFAHGFCVLSEEADFLYQCSDYYDPTSEVGVLWNDPRLAIDWPLDEPILSDKDLQNSLLEALPETFLPTLAKDPSL